MTSRCLGIATALAVFVLGLPASSTIAVSDEFQVTQLFGGSDNPTPTDRVGRMEEQMRTLTGQIEEMSYQLRQMQDQIRQLDEDIEYRLQVLESISGISSAQVPSKPVSVLRENNGQQQIEATELNGTVGTLGQLRVNPEVLDQIAAGTSTSVVEQPLDLGAISGSNSGSGQQQENIGGEQIASIIDPNIDSNTLYDNAYGSLLSGNYAAASEQFEYFIEKNPNDPLASDAQFWLGDSYFARQQYRDAASAYFKNYTEYPENSKVSESLLKLGLSLRGMGEVETACATFSELLAKFPEAPNSIKEKAKAELDRGECT